MKKKSSKSIIISFFAVAFFCTGFFVVKTYQNINQTKIQNRQMESLLQFLILNESVFFKIQQLEKSQNAFIVSQSESLKKDFKNSISNLITDTSLLKNAITNNPENKSELKKLNYLLFLKINNAKEILDDNKIIVSANTELLSDLKDSKIIQDSIKNFVINNIHKNRAILAGSNYFFENITGKANYSFFVLSLIFFGILIIFSFIISREFKKEENSSVQLNYQASLINTIPDAIFTTDENFTVKSWNKYAAELYGIPETEAIGEPLKNLFKIENTEEKTALNYAQLQTSGYYKDEYWVTKKNGERIIILASINSIVNSENEITGYIALHRNITSSKKLEEELKLFNTELELQVKNKTAEITNILDRITDGFLALDDKFTFTFVNNKAGEILGYLPTEMFGKNIFNDFFEITSAEFNEACSSAFNTQQFVFFENHYSPKNIWIENYIYPSANGISVFFKDVTFKRKAEISIKESEERYRDLITNLQAGVLVLNPDSSISLCNFEASRLFGFSKKSEVANDYIIPEWQYFTETGKQLAKHEFPAERVIATQQPIINLVLGIETALKNERVWVQANAYPELDKFNKLIHVIITFVDITERIRAAEKIKQNEETLNRAQRIAKIGNWEFNLQTLDLKWSDELYRIFEIDNHNSKELYLNYRNKFHPDDLSKLDTIVQHAIETKKGYKYQHRIICNNGDTKHILGIGEIIFNTAGEITGLKGTAQDITELIKAEEKLQISYQQIKQLVTHLQDIREEERKNIAREIHDELGQQLTGLKMQISWLSKKIIDPEKDIKEKFINTIALIEETITSVRKISTDLRPSMLDDLGLIAALEWQSNEFEKRSGISTEFINLTGNIEIPARLTTGIFRIFQESLTNVARHADAEKIISFITFSDGNITLTVKDDGIGFIVKNIESKKTLGLFGMKERTIEMGGEYRITSEPGLGTTVTIIVPA